MGLESWLVKSPWWNLQCGQDRYVLPSKISPDVAMPAFRSQLGGGLSWSYSEHLVKNTWEWVTQLCHIIGKPKEINLIGQERMGKNWSNHDLTQTKLGPKTRLPELHVIFCLTKWTQNSMATFSQTNSINTLESSSHMVFTWWQPLN